MRVSKGKSRQVKAVFRIRGQDQDAVELPCEDWQQAVQQARRVLPHFEQRNPWLYFDSHLHKLYVLLDPDTDLPMTHPSMRAQPKVRNMRKKGTHL